jgi:3-deoxy-D-manno-octulosonic-acid transferase
MGEILAISSLVTKIKSQYPQHRIVVTVTTKTGYEMAQKKWSEDVIVIPSPLDFTWVVEGFVRLIKPRLYIVAETEIWPNLYNYLHKHNVPIVIVNGRISDVSFGRYKIIKSFLKNVLNKVSLFLMQSDLDASRIIELGALKDKTFNVGNVKFDDLSLVQEKNDLLIPPDRLLWIAGSTHPGEEDIVLNTYNHYKNSCSLIIAPRHVERSEQIIKLIQSKGLKAVRFSQVSFSTWTQDTVIVVDTIGHLRSLYAKASFVFVGKSLCIGGGHNIIEPAVYAKPIIIGPKMENFRDITALFKAKGAVIQVSNTQEFEQEVGRLIQDKSLRNQLGQQALAVVQSNQGALDRTFNILKKWL